MIEVSTGPLSQRASRQEIQAREELGLTTESRIAAVEALRRFRELKKKADFRELVRYARICRVERIMRPYLEATL